MSRPLLVKILWAVAGWTCLAALRDQGPLYGGFHHIYGFGATSVPPVELVFYLLYAVFGGMACLFFVLALVDTPVASRLSMELAKLTHHRAPLILMVILLAMVFFVQQFVLFESPLTDDEWTYDFIARTLLKGRMVNPSPGDAEFFVNQFIVVDDKVWYGKYPVGHPAVLALARVLGLESLAIPLVTCFAFLVSWCVGERLFGKETAVLAGLMLLLSPQFVFTGATRLSQPTACLCLMAGVWALVRLAQEPRLLWAALAGVWMGLGVLVRPMPGAIFVAVAALFTAFCARNRSGREQFRLLAAFSVPIAVVGGLLLWINTLQTGHPLKTGYHAYHKDLGFLPGQQQGAVTRLGFIGASLGGGLIRQNAWLFGWPLSFALLPFVFRRRDCGLLWSMAGADYLYRILIPKTVVAVTGPIYLAEIVPVLALLSACGLIELRRLLERLEVGWAGSIVPSVFVSGFLVAALAFVPLQVREVRKAGLAPCIPRLELARAKVHHALIFANQLTDGSQGRSWARLPPNPSPDLDDDVIWVRWPQDPKGAGRAFSFWKRRFSDRNAFTFRYVDHLPVLKPVRTVGDL